MVEHKQWPALSNKIMLFFKEGSSISINLMSAWLTFSMRLHTPFVRLPAKRTKVVTVLQLPQSTNPPLKVLGRLLHQTLILPFVRLWRATNVDDLVDDLGCQWGVLLMIRTWRIARVWERGESWGQGNFMMRGLLGGFEEGFVGGVFVVIFQMGVVEVPVVDVEIVPGGCCGVSFGDDWWVSFSVGVLGWVQSFF